MIGGRPPAARIVRQGQQRTRLRLAQRRGDESFLNWLAVQLSTLPGVTHASAHALTGSVLILHNGDPGAILDRAVGEGLFAITRDEPKAELDMAAARVAVPVATAGLLAALAVWQLLRGRALPPAVTLAWYAATLALPMLLAETKKE
jgi:hypothetical protein